MERHREARRASIVGSNGFNRRRHRTDSIRDSPDEDGGLELQESVRLRDRVKKDRERDRDRERERERERVRVGERDLREKSSRNKRRRGNREDIGGDETSEEESLNDDEDDEDEENTTGGTVRLLPPAVGFISNHHHHGHNSNHHHHTSSFSQQHNSNGTSTSNTVSTNHHLQHRKSFPPVPSSAKISRAPPVWKSGDEMISVPVPRKARSASTKRSHDWMSISSNNSGGGVPGVEQNLAQPSSSPARQGVAPTVTPTLPPPPMSPSSSNASIRKKLKPTANNSGQKLKPPKAVTKPSSNSSNPEELEIEIAEVLFGLMTQSQAPSSKKEDSREINRLSSDAKSPVSNSTSANNLISGSNYAPLSVVAPKRKRPREIPENTSYGARSTGIQAKPDPDQERKNEKISGSVTENGYGNSVHPQPPEPVVPAKIGSEVKPASEEASSPKEKESPAVRIEASQKGDPPVAVTTSSAAETTKSNSTASEVVNRKEEKIEIDLMAPPPQVRPSPERGEKTDSRDPPVAKKAVIPISDAAAVKDEVDENGKSERDDSLVGEKKVKAAGEDVESKVVENKERNVELHPDLKKCEREGDDGVNTAGNGNKSQSSTQEQPLPEKSGHSTSSLPLPMSVASWPGGPPPMGYMAPLQGVVSMEDGAVAAPGHIPPLFTQPRPKRCATHCHIARNIHYLQQFMKMNPFWPPPAASASLFGSKPCNLNAVPAPDIHGNVAVRGANTSHDKGPNHVTKEKEKASQPASALDSGQRKQQILIQQALPPVAPSNLLGPAFIFPLNQQQSAAPRPSGAKFPAAAAGVSSNTSGAAVTCSSSAAAVSFNYPNMASNETQYLAIVQNNGYSFPIPAAAVGAPPNYRGNNPAQAMPLFNGPFYSSQMIHPSQLQHVQPPSIQSQLLQAHQNASASSGSSASQKQMQSQQQRNQSGGISSGSGTASLQNLSSQKTQPPLQLQQSHNQYVHQSRPRHHEGEAGREDSPSTTDSRGSRGSMNIYGQNFSMPIHPPNFGLMPHPAALASAGSATATSASTNHSDKKGHRALPQGSKAVPDTLPAHSFAMTFGTMNGAAAGPGIDISSMAQNHAAIFQNSSEVRQNIQMMAAAAAAQAAQKNYRVSDDGKPGGVDSAAAAEDELKSLNGKELGGGGQSIAFTRSDVADGPVSSVIESSTRSLNATASGAAHGSRSMTTNASAGAMNVQNAHNIQAQLQQQHMLQLKQHQRQQMHHQQQQQMQQQQIAASPTKVGGVHRNGSMYPEHLNSSSKFPNAPSGFPQNLVHNNSSSSSPSQSPQWKASGRPSTPQTSSSLASSTTTTLKNLPQQQHSRTQISFGGNQKPSVASQGPNNNQTTSPQMMVCSPTTSSITKGASGSPRTSSASTNNKTSQASSLSAQPTKNSPSVTNHKSPSIPGNPHVAAAIGSIQNSQLQQMPKAMLQQLFFSNPYVQSQPPHSSAKSSATSGPSGYYTARRQTDQYQQSPSAPVTSGGGLSLCPPDTLGGANTNDPATAIAAATANVKGGGLLSQSIIHASQTVLPASFSYTHPVPAAVPVKPAEQKQPAGNDNLHPWQPEKK